jgi:hypothetical protein
MKKMLSIPGQVLISGLMSGIAIEVVAFLTGKREDGFHAAPLATSQIHKISMKTTLPITLSLLASAWGALAQAPVLDDAQIAAVVIDANLIDIEAGKLAQFKSKDPEVQFFAPAYGDGSRRGQGLGDRVDDPAEIDSTGEFDQPGPEGERKGKPGKTQAPAPRCL